MDNEDLRLLEEQRNRLMNAWLNSATNMREYNAMREALPKLPTRTDLPRDQMTAADYCRVRKHDRDALGRRIK
jgi:hypothetical protein